MPYPLPLQEGIDIYNDIYEKWCIIGVPSLTGVPTEDMLFGVHWFFADDLNITPMVVPCLWTQEMSPPTRIDDEYTNPMDTGLVRLFLPPLTNLYGGLRLGDLDFSHISHGIIAKVFDKYNYPTPLPQVDIVSLMAEPGIIFDDGVSQIYADHSEILCRRR